MKAPRRWLGGKKTKFEDAELQASKSTFSLKSKSSRGGLFRRRSKEQFSGVPSEISQDVEEVQAPPLKQDDQKPDQEEVGGMAGFIAALSNEIMSITSFKEADHRDESPSVRSEVLASGKTPAVPAKVDSIREDLGFTGMSVWNACKVGNQAAVANALDQDPSLVNKKRKGKTLLYHACHNGHADLTMFLLERGAEDLDGQAYNTAMNEECRHALREFGLSKWKGKRQKSTKRRKSQKTKDTTDVPSALEQADVPSSVAQAYMRSQTWQDDNQKAKQDMATDQQLNLRTRQGSVKKAPDEEELGIIQTTSNALGEMFRHMSGSPMPKDPEPEQIGGETKSTEKDYTEDYPVNDYDEEYVSEKKSKRNPKKVFKVIRRHRGKKSGKVMESDLAAFSDDPVLTVLSQDTDQSGIFGRAANTKGNKRNQDANESLFTPDELGTGGDYGDASNNTLSPKQQPKRSAWVDIEPAIISPPTMTRVPKKDDNAGPSELTEMKSDMVATSKTEKSEKGKGKLRSFGRQRKPEEQPDINSKMNVVGIVGTGNNDYVRIMSSEQEGEARGVQTARKEAELRDRTRSVIPMGSRRTELGDPDQYWEDNSLATSSSSSGSRSSGLRSWGEHDDEDSIIMQSGPREVEISNMEEVVQVTRGDDASSDDSSSSSDAPPGACLELTQECCFMCGFLGAGGEINDHDDLLVL